MCIGNDEAHHTHKHKYTILLKSPWYKLGAWLANFWDMFPPNFPIKNISFTKVARSYLCLNCPLPNIITPLPCLLTQIRRSKKNQKLDVVNHLEKQSTFFHCFKNKFWCCWLLWFNSMGIYLAWTDHNCRDGWVPAKKLKMKDFLWETLHQQLLLVSGGEMD